ncbi:MAG: CRISPR-associated endonuclease Cas1 [Deltaproteobacteria bacterium]|nr:CRISPR-associated endonuclease Cas1 [Deltaproteobacteria bacterium]
MENPVIQTRMVTQFAFCPRLGFLELSESEFEDNQYTVDGNSVHRRIDDEKGELPTPEEISNTTDCKVQQVLLSSEEYMVIAKIDLLEISGGEVIPVEYKRGHEPSGDLDIWYPDEVQIVLQSIILRENGYTVNRGIVWYHQNRKRVEIEITDSRISSVLKTLSEFKIVIEKNEIPPPLIDSKKCSGCSLAPICLPDEINYIEGKIDSSEVRRFSPPRDDTIPLYIQGFGLSVSKKGETVEVKEKGKLINSQKLLDLSHICIYGNSSVSSALIRECFLRTIPVAWFSYGGWFCGISIPHGPKNSFLKKSQYLKSDSSVFRLNFSKRIVHAKISNQRTMLRRNAKDLDDNILRSLDELKKKTEEVEDIKSLLGIEGMAAKYYFGAFSSMLKSNESVCEFKFETRNRRPPGDPVNALLSYLYSILAKDCSLSLMYAGFDPYMGFYHIPRFGRPSLALDFMEEFRPLIVDSTVITLINNKMISISDFIKRGNSVAMKPGARKTAIQAYEKRMDQLYTHPVFGYRISYRRILHVQAQLLSRYIKDQATQFPEFTTR